MSTVRVTIKGGPELARAFDALEEDLPEAYRDAFGPVTDKIVGRTRSMMPRISGDARGAVNSDGATISFGDVPYQPWLDFGGDTGKSVRPYIHGGRYLYPSIGQSEAELEDAAGDAVLEAARRNSFDVSR